MAENKFNLFLELTKDETKVMVIMMNYVGEAMATGKLKDISVRDAEILENLTHRFNDDMHLQGWCPDPNCTIPKP